MGWGRGDFSLLTTFNIKHCKMLQFPVLWLLPFCLLASPHHLRALVILLDTSVLFNLFSTYNIGDAFSLQELLWYMLATVHSAKHSIEQMKNSAWTGDPARTLFHSYWGRQQVEECPALLWGHVTAGLKWSTVPANLGASMTNMERKLSTKRPFSASALSGYSSLLCAHQLSASFSGQVKAYKSKLVPFSFFWV